MNEYSPLSVRRRAVCLAIVLVCLLLHACAGEPTKKDTQNPTRADGSPACEGVFTVAPDFYSNSLDGSVSLLFTSSGTQFDVPVYCTAKEALYALYALEENAPASKGSWRVYELEADWELDVVAVGSHDQRLRAPALLKRAVTF